MTGISLYPLASVAIGVACAAAGVYVVPATPGRAEMDRALLRTGIATVAACAWALWRDEIAATLVPFVAAIFLLGELRVRLQDRARTRARTRALAQEYAQTQGQAQAQAQARAGASSGRPRFVAQPQPSSSPSSSPSRGSSR